MMQTSPSPYQYFVGVDIAAANFTIADHIAAPPRTFPQTAAGRAAFLALLHAVDVPPQQTLILMEATGTYWIAVATALHEAGYQVSVVNAMHAHHFAKSRGQRAKTDRSDARMLLHFAMERQPTPWCPPPAVYHELRQRLATRALLHRTRTQLRNHRHAVQQCPVVVDAVLTHLAAVIATLEVQIATLDAEIAAILAKGAWAASAALLQTIPSVGPITTAWLLVETVNFTISPHPKALVAYAGLAPMPYESGTSVRGRPEIGHSGNRRLRYALYMATVSGVRFNPMLKRLYERLRAAGKPVRVARCAAARKLLHLAWAVVTKRRAFDPNYAGGTAAA